MQYNFEWDPAKARQNLRKHGVSFERASQVFLDPLMISVEDEEHSEDEERWATLGRERTRSCWLSFIRSAKWMRTIAVSA